MKKATAHIPLIAIVLLFASTKAFAEDKVLCKQTKETIVLARGKTPILTYHVAEVPPPKGVNPIYNRSGFIFPMHAPGGGIVTGIHPGDHYHHLGLWHAWVNTQYEGKKGPDFWNLGKGTGRIRHAKVNEVRKAGFTVEQEHLAYPNGAKSKPVVILEETLSIDASFVDNANVVDYVMIQRNVTKKPLVFPANRYGGGIAYRGPHFWNKDNSDYLTSDGLDRKNSHTSRARWVAMHGPTQKPSGKLATVVIMCHPKNRDAPQRIRTWDNGKMFFNYVPTQEKGWSIQPNQTLTLRYRIVILDGKTKAKQIEERWKAYLN